MANKHVEMLMEAVAKLQADVEWLKKFSYGMAALMGTTTSAVVINLLVRR